MVWMQNLVKNRRRNQSQSPSSSDGSQRSFFGRKHKRRSLRKNSSVTESSMCSTSSCERTDNAAWRVENIRKAPPTGDEWWETACESNDSQDDEEDYSDDGNTDAYDTVAINALSQEKRFHNCGLKTWHKVRKEWTKRTVESLPPRPTAAEYSQLVKGLTKHSSMRTYELPRRMALSDLISVYNDIWEGDGM